MVNNRCNPFLDAPLTVRRVVLMAIAAVVFILGVIYGTVRGAFWTWCGRTRERRLDDFHRIMHKVFKLDLRLHPWLFCDIHNPYNETFERGSIAICNHQPLIDPLCLLILSPKLLIVTGKRVWENPIVKPVLRLAEFTCTSYTMDEMIEYCRYHIDRGYTVVFFPEGERSQNGRILRFHSGAFHIAKILQADILPLYIHGTGHVLPTHKAFQNRAKLYVEIGQRVLCDDKSIYTDTRKQANAFRRHYRLYYEELCRKLEDTDYFAELVAGLFGRVGKRGYALDLLRRYHNFSAWIDTSFDDYSYVLIDDHTEGVFTLLFALVHPYVPVYAIGADSLKMLYQQCTNLPVNINFVAGANAAKVSAYKPLFSVEDVVKVQVSTVNNKKNNYETAYS